MLTAAEFRKMGLSLPGACLAERVYKDWTDHEDLSEAARCRV